MDGKKSILIITDDSKATTEMAAGIATALKDNKVSVMDISVFKGNDILPADAFFLGCEKPNPGSFAYIEDLFLHINLAGRPCGVFSPGCMETAKYLAGLVHDSEAALNPNHLLDTSEKEINDWSQNVISKSF
jgi:hypothetical protein